MGQIAAEVASTGQPGQKMLRASGSLRYADAESRAVCVSWLLQERKQQLQQEAEELQEQLAHMQRMYEQQQQLLQELRQQQQQQQSGQQQVLLDSSGESVGSTAGVTAAEPPQQQQQQQLEPQLQGESGEQLYHQAAQQQLVAQLDSQHHQQQDVADMAQHLPVSVPASSGVADASRQGLHHAANPAAAAAAVVVQPGQRSYMPGDYASAVEDASSAAGSMVDSSLSGAVLGQQHWEDDSTASSKVAGGRSWFGMFGKSNSRQGRSALV